MTVWFVTGSSRGFGRLLTGAALARGDRVAATARHPEEVAAAFPDAGDRLLALPLDVTDPGQAGTAVRAAVARFGRIDVLVNNAGYGLFGSVEETPDAEVRRLFDTNVFGLLAVTRAVLPVLRAQRAGHVINVSSSAGFVAGAGRGLYGASKFAVEAISEALQGELAPLGVHVTVVEPGSFRTDFLSADSHRTTPVTTTDYAGTVGRLLTAVAGSSGQQPGDPDRAVAALLQVAGTAEPPFRLPLGTDALALVEGKLAAVRDELERWRELSAGTDVAPEPAGPAQG